MRKTVLEQQIAILRETIEEKNREILELRQKLFEKNHKELMPKSLQKEV
jgi:hypothetical protein